MGCGASSSDKKETAKGAELPLSSLLPQNTKDANQRSAGIRETAATYNYQTNLDKDGKPWLNRTIDPKQWPEEEEADSQFVKEQLQIFVLPKTSDVRAKISQVINSCNPVDVPEPFQRYEDFLSHCGADTPDLLARWQDDEDFARRLLNGITPMMLQRCTDAHLAKFVSTGDGNRPNSGLGDLVSPVLPHGVTLESLKRDGLLYVVDYEESGPGFKAANAHRNDKGEQDRFYTVPIILLYVDKSKVEEEKKMFSKAKAKIDAKDLGRLMPLAIQLFQGEWIPEGHANPVFVPPTQEEMDNVLTNNENLGDNAARPKEAPIIGTPDERGDFGCWKLAKMFVAQQQTMWHIAVEHIAMHHLFFQPFIIAARKTMSSVHPLMHFMIDHFWMHLNLASNIQDVLMTPEGDLSVKFVNGYEGLCEITRSRINEMDISRFHPEHEFGKEGRDVEDVPKYFWRDDMKRVWSLIKPFIAGLVDNIYAEDADVVADNELAAYQKALGEEFDQFNMKNVLWKPEGFKTKDEVKAFFSWLLYMISPHHSSVHSCAWEGLGFIPVAPAILRSPPPTAADCIYTDRNIVEGWLPFQAESFEQIVFFKGVDYHPKAGYHRLQYTPNLDDPNMIERIGMKIAGVVPLNVPPFDKKYYKDSDFQKAFDEFQKGLVKMGKDIGTRLNTYDSIKVTTKVLNKEKGVMEEKEDPWYNQGVGYAFAHPEMTWASVSV